MAFEHELAVRVHRKHRDGVTVVCPLRERLFNGVGIVHGGVIASIADEAAWHAIVHHLGRRAPMTTTELKINYLRPITGKRILGRASLVRAGRTLCVTRVDLYDQQRRLAALAIVTYMLLEEPR